MFSSVRTDEENFDGPEKTNTATIRRTIVEHGIRPVNQQNGSSVPHSMLQTITKQHDDDQRELQELNNKLSTYLDHVHDLETFNGQLLAELDEVKQKWSNNTGQLNQTYGPDLMSLRNGIDNSLRDQILQELTLRRFENDIGQTQQRINAFEGDVSARLNAVQEELYASTNDLENLTALFDRRSADLVQQRTNLNQFVEEFDGLQVELLNQRLERLMVQNELQTLREHASFEDANYQAQREEILSLSVPAIDLARFYRNELARAILDIRQDFQVHSQSQLNEMEEYYRSKTEEIHEKIEQENERKRLLNVNNDEVNMSSVVSSWTELNEEYKQLKLDNHQLEIDFNDTVEDLTRIREEQTRENEKSNLNFNRLQQELENNRAVIDQALENNVSLRFELLTYRNLLNSEEKHLNRKEQLQTSSDSNDDDQKQLVQKMVVKKTTAGSIVFDSIDLINDTVSITYEKKTGDHQSLENWTVRRQNDQQPEIVYQFPPEFMLKPGQIIRILSKCSPESARSEKDVLLADQIETWGLGQSMTTRLFNNSNQEKANISLTRLPA